jgi:hypothetical protein
MTESRPSIASVAVRALAVVGMLGGVGLLLAFFVEIPTGWNTARVVLFGAGAIAIGVALYGRQAAASRRLALAGTIPLIVANGWSITWILLAVGRERPFAGDFGLVGFWGGLVVWLADAGFGLVALRLGVAWSWAALVLVAGSLLAITGMDRLELTSQAHPTVFGPMSLLGIGLNGLAWVVLGINVLERERRWQRRQGTTPVDHVRELTT